MFPYDSQLLAAVQTPPISVADVLATMQSIDALTIDTDGLHWFNWLYSQVTKAVEDRINTGRLCGRRVSSELDVQFAQLYFDALKASLSDAAPSECWQTLFVNRGQTNLTRIQCALAGINAHINHDLPIAIVNTCRAMNLVPQHGTVQYTDYTALNSNLDSLIDEAKQTLNVRLPGDELPDVTMLESTIAGWGVSAAREAAWKNAELLWHLRGEALLSVGFLDTLDGLTTVVSKGLLVQIP